MINTPAAVDDDSAGPSMPVGQFRWDPQRDRWWWSSGMFTIHGYRPHALPVTTDLLLQHKTNESRARAQAVIAKVRIDNEPFTNYHQIENAAGQRRSVLVIGQPVTGADGVRVAAGFMADVTDPERAAGTLAVEAARRNRAPIEQARGAVMTIYGLKPDAALALLIWFSQNNNVKLAVLCRRLTTAVAAADGIQSRAQFDQLLARLAAPPADR